MISKEGFFVRCLTLIIAAVFFSVARGAEVNVPAASVSVIVELANGTANGAAVEGDKVILRVYRHEQIVKTLDGVADKDGKAVFTEVPCGDHAMGVINAIRRDMSFGTSPVPLTSGTPEITAKMQVFDISYDLAKLSVPIHHLIIKAQQNSLLITEYLQLENPSDMTINSKDRDSSDRPIVLKIMLPKGFKNFSSSSYFEESALAFTEEGFYDTMAVPPGKHSITFSYVLDIPASTFNIVKKISLPTSSLVVFAELNNAKIEGLGTPTIASGPQGTPMEFYTLKNLAANSEVNLRITGLSAASSGIATWVILGLVFLFISVLAIAKLLSGKRPQESLR
jgi:hypothetical protein